MMASLQIAGAVPNITVTWNTINWKKATSVARRLQARIVKATRKGRWNKVKVLQRLLTHSFSAKSLAIKRVTENKGKRTPGVDREIWKTPTRKFQAIGELKKRGYHPQPLRRIYIPKKGTSNKKRPLSIPTFLDRSQQALHLLALDPIAETLADGHSYGFRKHRSTTDAISQCFRVLSTRYSAKWVLEGDIHSCFDEISSQWLQEFLPMDKEILRKWLNAGFISRGKFYPTHAGTPQGGIASPTMCNYTLDGLQRELADRFGDPQSGESKKHKINLVRYCDDFIITGTSKEILEQEVMPLLKGFLSKRDLKLSEKKTKIVHISEGFDFLGQNIREYKNGKLLIKPSKQSVKSLLEKLRQIVKKSRSHKTSLLIMTLNPIIRGWCNYHRHVVSKSIFQKIDHEIFTLLWKWAVYRHPNKSARWIKYRYFIRKEGRDWTFSAFPVEKIKLNLLSASDVEIKRHVKIKSYANPYDPEDEVYFDKRLTQKWINGEKGIGKLRRLWLGQKGLCPLCQQKITEETEWHTHHILYRVHGGGDTLDNLILMHPTCHRQFHSQNLTVEKPDYSSTKDFQKA